VATHVDSRSRNNTLAKAFIMVFKLHSQ